MAEKKYCGIGFKSKFGVNVNLNLNQFFKHLYETTNDKNVMESFKLLKTVLEKNKTSYIQEYTTKEGKIEYSVKTDVTLKKDSDSQYNVALNEYVKTTETSEKTQTKQAEPELEDMPF
jgi:hypothetical protein